MPTLILRKHTVGPPPPGGGEFYEIPADRTTLWKPGVTYNGGIPSRSTVYTTITSTNDTTDRRATIQAAIDACPAGQVVLLGAGEFYLSAPLILNKDNITLRGTRTSTTVYTKLMKPAAHRPNSTGSGPNGAQGTNPHSAIIISRASSLNLDGATTPFASVSNLSVTGTKGSYSVTVESTNGFAVGDLVRLDELSGAAFRTDPRGGGTIWANDDYRTTYQCADPPDGLGDFTGGVLPAWFAAYTVFDRPNCEMKKIASIAGNVVTFTTPLHIEYRAGTTYQARIAKYNGTVVRNSGIENISAYGFNGGTFSFWLADQCWMQGCEADYWFDKPFRFAAAFQCEVRRSIHHRTPWPSNSAENYGFIFDWASSDCLIEDSIGFMCNKVTAARAAGAGCVVAYCYLDAGTIGYSPSDTWVEVGANASHFNGPHHVLFEGNLSWNADSDFTHGNSIYITHFRNWYTGHREPFVSPITGGTYNDKTDVNSGGASPGPNGLKRCAATQSFGYAHSFVSNVLGFPGLMSGWALEGSTIFDDKRVYMPGWAPTAARTAQDPNVKNASFWGAILRDGNFDYLTNKVLWHGLGGTASATHTTPPPVSAMKNSLYLTAKPAFFGPGDTWPWVTPEGATKVYSLPARVRYDSGDYFS
jgi:hypothetical protein